ncbi:uncharacterized protein LOC114528216 [Dendronephthya gigantea]|uniref:uncharacterized protein LOC114528216 n=1 Tax=Dendronephthya gigantea TaxID=151771 RepID=UPI00106993B2|nr:uncharacterized protein LOC114528216 [Dendronephthya gigantea]
MSNRVSCLTKLLKVPVASKCNKNIIYIKGVDGHVLAGPKSCGKTSLLFEHAITCAENGDSVLFIAPKVFTKLPLFVNGRKQPSTVVLERIYIVYLANYVELIEYFASAHLDRSQNPRVVYSRHVLIDDFDWYFQEKKTRTEDTNRLAKCMAYMIDALKFWSKNMEACSDATSSFVLAETVQGDVIFNAEKLGLYMHWISNFIQVQKLGNSFFCVQRIKNDECTLLSDLLLHYQIDNNAITVKEQEF